MYLLSAFIYLPLFFALSGVFSLTANKDKMGDNNKTHKLYFIYFGQGKHLANIEQN